MKKKIDLTKILKDCPKGTKLYSTKEKAEIRAKNLSVNSVYSEPYAPINYEILELEVIE